jgi:hypothetical protein
MDKKMNVHTFIHLMESGFRFFRAGKLSGETLLIGLLNILAHVDPQKTHEPSVAEELEEVTMYRLNSPLHQREVEEDIETFKEMLEKLLMPEDETKH